MKEKKRSPFTYLIIGAIILVVLLLIGSSINMTPKIEYSDFVTMVNDHTYKDETNIQVRNVKIVGTTIYVRLLNSKITEEDFNSKHIGDYYFIISTNAGMESLEQFLDDNKAQIKKTYDRESENLLSVMLPYISILIVAVIGFMFIRNLTRGNAGANNFGKSRAKVGVPSKVKFSDVAGAKEEKVELKEIVDFLKNPKKFTDLGARIPKGVILVGPPGTGKTMLAKAVAGESNVPFFRISGSDFVEMFVGVGASRVRDLFETAKKNAPAIIFIDEIDAVGRQRGTGLGGGNDEREQTLNQLLVEMDGFEATQGIIVMAATNRPDVLDPALLRPGRFDRQIYVNMPDVGEREQILLVHAKNKKFADDVNFKNIARVTTGFSGADLENLLNEAAILAARDDRPRITNADLNNASTKVMMGPQKKSKTVTEKDKKITAYHESGHAILHKLLPYCDDVQEVSIIPRGMAGGYTMSRPDNDENYASYNKLNNMIASMMGGRIAEEIIFGDITTGASNDIEQATKLARKMVTQFGMSKKLGFINLGSSSEVFIGRDYQNTVLYSESTAKSIDEEMEKILNANYEQAKKLLLENIDKLHALAELLILRETVFEDEVDMVMNGVPNSEIIKVMEERENKQKEEFEREKQAKKEEEALKIKQLQELAFNVLKQEGMIPQNAEKIDTADVDASESVSADITSEKENQPSSDKNSNKDANVVDTNTKDTTSTSKDNETKSSKNSKKDKSSKDNKEVK